MEPKDRAIAHAKKRAQAEGRTMRVYEESKKYGEVIYRVSGAGQPKPKGKCIFTFKMDSEPGKLALAKE